MADSSPINISLRLDVVRAWHICGLWGNEKRLKAEVIESINSWDFNSCKACSRESCTYPAVLRPSLALGPPARWLLLLSQVLFLLTHCRPICWGCFLLTLIRPMAETKGRQPRPCCPAREDTARHGKNTPLPGPSSSQASGCQGGVCWERLPPRKSESLVEVPWAHRAPGSNSSSDLESWETTVKTRMTSHFLEQILMCQYFLT